MGLTSELLLYGAAGFTATLVRSEAAGRLPMVCAARRARAPGGAPVLELTLDDPVALRRALESYSAVLNCAGPFASTWRPLVEACLDTGTHYLDLAAEWAVFEEMQHLDAVARERGVMLLPGVGFDVAASDCLAAHVASRLPGVSWLQIGIAGLELLSRGSAETLLDLTGKPTRVRRGGVLADARGIEQAQFDFGRGPTAALAVSWADIVTAPLSTGASDVTVYFEATAAALGLELWNRSFGWMLRGGPLRGLLRGQLGWLPEGPSAAERARRRAVLVARAGRSDGVIAESRLETPEAYTFTARSAVAICEQVLAGAVKPGFQTPASLLGPDFPLTLPDVSRIDRV